MLRRVVRILTSLGDQVIIQRYAGVGTGEDAERAMEIAIKKGAEVIFTTMAPMITGCRRVAARYPETKILNYSVCIPYADVRTYYSRIYEDKFMSGAIAGALSTSNIIVYIASYPFFGVTAGINAFALANMLKEGIKNGTVDPFLWKVVTQEGVVRNDGTKTLSIEEILQMDWLCDNVIGANPEFDFLSEKAKVITCLQGI